jgi:hypothetical protein
MGNMSRSIKIIPNDKERKWERKLNEMKNKLRTEIGNVISEERRKYKRGKARGDSSSAFVIENILTKSDVIYSCYRM